MKKILFMLINMNVGGTEKALLSMLEDIPKDKYEITILMLEKRGGFLDTIPSNVHVEYLNNYENIKYLFNSPPQTTSIRLLKKGKLIKAFNILLLHLIYKLTKYRTPFLKYLLKDYPVVDKEYDIAIAYAGPMDLITYYVLNKIKAKKKFQWIHFDITKIPFNHKYAYKMYRRFDKIFVVSEEAKNKLINKVPKLRDKTEVLLNRVPEDLIRSEAKLSKGFSDDFNGVRILTVGRLSLEKGQDLAIAALARLIDQGYNVKWYCVGEGNARKKYEQLIEEYNLKDKFILIGLDPNPYAYMEQCDIYVQPSRFECYCTTISEVKCFNKPIISTNVNGVKEQIDNNETGLIVDIGENNIYSAIKLLIDNNELCGKIRVNLSRKKHNNSLDIEEFFGK